MSHHVSETASDAAAIAIQLQEIESGVITQIARVARKEVRAQTQTLKKAVAAYRSEIASLKRRTQALEQEVRRLGKGNAKPKSAVASEEKPTAYRFSAKGLASQRRRLGLSAADCGLLVGASGLSIYKWESGQAQPRAKFLAAIAGLRAMGKNEDPERPALHSQAYCSS